MNFHDTVNVKSHFSPEHVVTHELFIRTGVAVASGLAATMTIVHMLKAGDGIVCMDDVYGGEPRVLIYYLHSHKRTLLLLVGGEKLRAL